MRTEEASLGNGSSAGGGLKKRYVTLEYDLVQNLSDHSGGKRVHRCF